MEILTADVGLEVQFDCHPGYQLEGLLLFFHTLILYFYVVDNKLNDLN